ncbi:50S ribosomal protein L29 [Spiroplasma poulsonii]|uniref:Large ribosomal subunit protein uL29 n=1 Tax=Spiroplasma poulsonii TaxID=2138 RepID=A0A3S0UNU2_9MOLU|nr:50S ribosomal protein L29 [Spiroplasma poulsonii]MBW3058142.1 50S ribosomal protein L29 [Spiroplasma poulsonii]RUP78252.1 50S ribosomal protein L29 [Spiroplasma poulsonii]
MNDLNKKSVEELKRLEEESRAELFALRFQSAMGNLEKPHRIGELKKQISRILTILSSRKKDGENTAINVKINLSETYAKIEKESQEFAKQRKAKIDQIMAEQEGPEDNMTSLMDLPLTDAMEMTAEGPNLEPVAKADDKKPAVVKAATTKEVSAAPAKKPAAPLQESKPAANKTTKSAPKKEADKKPTTPVVKKEPAKPEGAKDAVLKSLIKKNEAAKAVSKPAAPTTSSKSTVTVKSVTSAKAEIEMPKVTKKSAGTNTAKKDVELNAKEKLAAMKSSISIGTKKGRGTGVKINLDLKTKDPKASEYTYGTNWKENRDKILTAGKTTKKADDKTTTKKGTGKK